MKKNIFILSLIFALLAGTFIAILYYSSLIYDVAYISMDIKISDHPGINVDSDALHFGKATSPGGADRYILVSNDYALPLKVMITSRGELSSWINLNESSFILEPAETRSIKVSAEIPSGVSYGNYTGTLKILFRKLII